MKKICLVLCTVAVALTAAAQDLRNANWCFGNNARLNFTSGNPVQSISGQNSNGTGNATISDKDGQLLFYTNGRTVWNRNHIVTPGGTGLFGGSVASAQTQQKATIVPKPGNDYLYYIFTNAAGPGNYPWGSTDGVFYSVFDIRLDNGNGDIVPGLKNIPLLSPYGNPMSSLVSGGDIPTYVKAAAITDQSETSIWMVFFMGFDLPGNPTRVLCSYKLTYNGINSLPDGQSPSPAVTSIVSNTNYPGALTNDITGSIQFSPNGLLLCDDASFVVNLFNFNRTTGSFTFNRTVFNGTVGTDNPGYGMDFSPDSRLIYFSTYGNQVVQQEKGDETMVVKLWQAEVEESKPTLIHAYDLPAIFPLPLTYPSFAIQRAINNRLYVCMLNAGVGGMSWQFLGVINNPNNSGTLCNFVPNALILAGNSEHIGNLPGLVPKAKGLWPKVYKGKAPEYLGKDGNGNFYTFIYQHDASYPAVNHLGSYPVSGGYLLGHTFHYTPLGTTDWYRADQAPVFVLQNNTMQMDTRSWSNLEYVRCSDGQNAVPAPFNIGSKHIIAETTTGVTFSHDQTNLYVYNGSTLIQSLTVPLISKAIFNRQTNRLYIYKFQWTNDVFEIYDWDGTQLQLFSASTFANDLNGFLAQVSPDGHIYFVRNHLLQEYNPATNIFTPITMPGFPNADIAPFFYAGTEPEERLIVGSGTDEYIYCLQTATGEVKRISTGNYISSPTWPMLANQYLFDGENLLLAGATGMPITIGMQSIGTGGVNMTFITLLNIPNDFINRTGSGQERLIINRAPEFFVATYPNPAGESLVVTTGNIKQENLTLRIYDQQHTIRVEYKQYQPGTRINIAGLQPGVYYAEIIRTDGTRTGRTIIKL